MNDTQQAFVQAVWEYYYRAGRHDLPWRLPRADGSFDAYKILVSEIMLQQTQVGRVVNKYQQFLESFPTVQALAKASLGEVLIAWQGLGYNRRAKFLWQTAQTVVSDYDGVFPHDQQELTKLPGVGFNTAGAVVAYAHNQPVVFVETNIRTVFIHHFFANADKVSDKAIIGLVQATLPIGDDRQGSANVRQWYWALMDYGAHIKQRYGNKSRTSKNYVKQSPFEGSRRAIRGAVIRYLAQIGQGTVAELAKDIKDARLLDVITDLQEEGLIVAESEPIKHSDSARVYRLA